MIWEYVGEVGSASIVAKKSGLATPVPAGDVDVWQTTDVYSMRSDNRVSSS